MTVIYTSVFRFNYDVFIFCSKTGKFTKINKNIHYIVLFWLSYVCSHINNALTDDLNLKRCCIQLIKQN